eukprot:8221863-Heterocapsa_arctica.AAC.1
MSGTPDIGMFCPRGNGAIDSMSAGSDSDWAKGAVDRRSTSCGMILVNDCLLYSFSRTQSVVALSSAAAEWYAKVA